MSEIDSAAPQPSAAWDDWITIWQSEWAALVTDREVHEALQRGIELWAAGARAAAPSDPAGRAGAAPPAGTAAPLATSDRLADPDREHAGRRPTPAGGR